MKTNAKITNFQRDCFANYVADIHRKVDDFPSPYLYPDGNPVRPVVPVQTTLNRVMLIGAFPSARFERRLGKLIPVGDNLAPFEPERYFDGSEVRIQESTESLHTSYFPQLGLELNDLWITDIVKVYLFPEKHLKNCRYLFPSASFTDTHKMFPQIALASRDWFLKELSVCNPRIVITLGEVAASIVGQGKGVLDGEIRDLPEGHDIKMVHLAHPESRRRNKSWDERTSVQLSKLAKQLPKYL
jgi:hypothetical protein